MMSSILFKIGVFSRHSIHRDDNLKPPERGLTRRVKNSTLSSRSHDHHRLDALVVQNLFQIGPKKLVRWRFNYRFSLKRSHVVKCVGGRRCSSYAIDDRYALGSG